MAKAIFHREFGFRSRRFPVGWHAYPGAQVQRFPREFIDAAVARGAATEIPPLRRGISARAKAAPAPTED